MARITVEDCIDKFPSRFELVLIASQRARRLYSGESPKIERDNDKNTVIALREIANLSFTIEEMKENLIQEYETVTINDEEEENIEFESSENEAENNNLVDSDNSSKQIEDEIKEYTLAEEAELESHINTDNEIEPTEEESPSDNEESPSDNEETETSS